MQRHATRRAIARRARSGGRNAMRGTISRSGNRQPRLVARRCRPAAIERPEYLPVAVH